MKSPVMTFADLCSMHFADSCSDAVFAGIPVRYPFFADTVYDLQRFAAEDEGRTKEATEKRKRREREKGNVAKSQDVTQAAVLLGTVLTLFVLSAWMLSNIVHLFTIYLNTDFAAVQKFGTEDVKLLIFKMFLETGKITAPVMIAAVIMGIAGNIMQTGLLFTTEPLRFRPERIAPDLKRILPVRRTIISLIKTVVQVLITGFLSYMIIVQDFIPMLKSPGMDLMQALALFAWVSFKLLLAAAVLFAVMAVPDYFYQRFEYLENLKMSEQEIKEEHKEEEGDPAMRRRQREIGMNLRKTRNMLQDVAKADVVITNPTHYAVALHYDPGTMDGPKVIAKGTDELALTIRRIARKHNILIEENPPVARELYRTTEIGQTIPADMYVVISRIFIKIDKFRRRAG